MGLRVIMTGRQSRRVVGRPDVNSFCVDEKMKVTPEQLAVVRELIESSGINAYHGILRKEGYAISVVTEGYIPLGEKIYFCCGERTRYRTLS